MGKKNISNRALKKFNKQIAERKALLESHRQSAAEYLIQEVKIPEVPAIEPKGKLGGRCNVTACQKENSAIFLNVGMKFDGPDAYYCHSCATAIDNGNTLEKDGFVLFPAMKEMKVRYRELWKSGMNIHDPDNYSDIDQDPWNGTFPPAI